MLTDPDGDYIELTEMHSPKKNVAAYRNEI